MIQKTVLVRSKSSFFYHFPKYHMETLLGDFNSKLGKEDIFKLTIGNESYIRIVMIMM
jgi:hypothetical protein